MDPTNMLELSFYEEIKPINNKKNVLLVTHVETGILFVKKIYTNYNLDVFNRIQSSNIPGIPKYKLLVEDLENQTLTIIEEYVNGINLENYLSLKDGPLSSMQAAEIIDKICNILQKLHNEIPPIIHRDIKPSNILITPENEIYIVDFNISRVLSDRDMDTTILGTQGYAAPEQYGFMQCNQQTDIYSLGVLLKFLLTKSPALPQKYQGLLAPVIRKATAMDPDNRYKTVSEFNQQVQVLINNIPSMDNPQKHPPWEPDNNPETKSDSKLGSQPEAGHQWDFNSHSKDEYTKEKLRVSTKGNSPRTINSENNPNLVNMISSETTLWFRIKQLVKGPFKMSMLAKVCFSVAVLLVLISFYSFSVTNGSSVIESILYLISYVLLLVFPPFALYYVYKRKLRLVKNPVLNVFFHLMLISAITIVLFLLLLILMVATDSF